MKPDYFSKIAQTTYDPREASGVRCIPALSSLTWNQDIKTANNDRIASPNPCGKRSLATLGTVFLLFSLSSHAQQLDQNATADPHTKVVAVTPYAIAARDGNQKIWSRVTWESNSITGELTGKT